MLLRILHLKIQSGSQPLTRSHQNKRLNSFPNISVSATDWVFSSKYFHPLSNCSSERIITRRVFVLWFTIQQVIKTSCQKAGLHDFWNLNDMLVANWWKEWYELILWCSGLWNLLVHISLNCITAVSSDTTSPPRCRRDPLFIPLCTVGPRCCRRRGFWWKGY